MAHLKSFPKLLGALFSVLIISCAQGTPLAIPPDASWHWQLQGSLKYPDRFVYDIDLYDTPTSTITGLKNTAHIVICYFSAGSWEDWREDASQYPTAALGSNLDGWAGERWLDIRNPQARALLAKRLDLAVDKGCHGVEPDNVDGYSNKNGLGLTKADQIDFNRWLAAEAHQRNLSIALKNSVELIPDLVDHFDFALNESCYKYNECGGYSSFRNQGKAVFIAEYRKYNSTMCGKAKTSGFNLQFFARALKNTGTPCT